VEAEPEVIHLYKELQVQLTQEVELVEQDNKLEELQQGVQLVDLV
jgi:hypothetical protein